MQPSLVCPQCTTTIPDDLIDVRHGLATCPNCAHTFDLPNHSIAAPPKYKTRAIPDRVRVFQSDTGLMLVINQRHWGELIHLLPFTVIWNGICWLMFGVALTQRESGSLCIGLFAFVGLFLVYKCAVMLLNKTKILVDEHGLAIITTPIPPTRSQTYNPMMIQDLYYDERMARSIEVNGRRVRPYDYDVYAWLTDDTHQCLFTADDEAIAMYVGQRLKAALGLSGEFEKRLGNIQRAFEQFEKRKYHE